MANDVFDRISQRAYALWEAEGRPEGRHDAHWIQAEQEVGPEAPADAADADTTEPGTVPVAHPGMLGDGTEEQNLDQPGNPAARITEDEVRAAFGDAAGKEDDEA